MKSRLVSVLQKPNIVVSCQVDRYSWQLAVTTIKTHTVMTYYQPSRNFFFDKMTAAPPPF